VKRAIRAAVPAVQYVLLQIEPFTAAAHNETTAVG
jgi:hypothetical protein